MEVGGIESSLRKRREELKELLRSTRSRMYTLLSIGNRIVVGHGVCTNLQYASYIGFVEFDYVEYV